jgi:hypothetical protein
MAEQGGAEQTEIQFGTVRNAVVHTPADDVVDVKRLPAQGSLR